MKLNRFLTLLAALAAATFACGDSAPKATPVVVQGTVVIPTPTQSPLGTSRNNPIPRGDELVLKDTEAVMIFDVTRPADTLVKQASPYTSDPGPGHETILISVQIRCLLKTDEDKQCRFDPTDYELTGSSGLVRNRRYVGNLTDFTGSQEFFPGVTFTGLLLFEIGTNETDLLLIYDPWLSWFTDPVYFALSSP